MLKSTKKVLECTKMYQKVPKTLTENKMTIPWPKAEKNHEFALQIQVFPGLQPRGGQIILSKAQLIPFV